MESNTLISPRVLTALLKAVFFFILLEIHHPKELIVLYRRVLLFLKKKSFCLVSKQNRFFIFSFRNVKRDNSDIFLEKCYTHVTLPEKYAYLEFFWFVFSPNAGKCGPKKL